MQTKKGFTLVELIVVIIIIGILSTLGITQYGGYREHALDREAQANLRLIIAAERIYRMEQGNYYLSPSRTNDAANINTELNLALTSGTSRVWDYFTASTGGSQICAQARRNGGNLRTWKFELGDADPLAGQACP